MYSEQRLLPPLLHAAHNASRNASPAFNRALKRTPPADFLLRKLEGERITDARRRIYMEFAGREVECPIRRIWAK
jgi:hypothetical protein